MNPSEVLAFFDLTRPCPEGIPDCNELRLQFEKDAIEVQKNGSCLGCAKLALREKYLDILLSKK